MERKEQTVLICVGANVLLVALRFVLAVVSGSLALKANAWHSLADIIVLTVVYVGFLLVRQRDQTRVGAIARMENIVAAIVAIFILWMGLELFGEAVGGEGVELAYLIPSAIGAFLGVCITYFMGRYMLFVGRETGSASLVAAGYHARMDMFCSVAVLIGLVGSIFGLTGLDRVAATIVVVFIFLAAIEILVTNLRALGSRKVEIGHEHAHGIKGPGALAMAAIVLLVVAGYLASGVYYVRPDERALVRRLGMVLGDARASGLHYRLPYPIDRVDMVRTTEVREADTEKRLLLSGDENLIEVSVAVHYRVADPVKYLLRAAAPDKLVQEAAEAGISRTVARMRIDELLTAKRQLALAETRTTLQQELDRNSTGIEVIGVKFLELRPPSEVVDAFYDVATAREDKITYTNEAYSFRNALVPKARGEAAEEVARAEAYKAEKTLQAQGEAARFVKKVTEYDNARDITRTRLYLEAIEKALPGARKYLVSGEIDAGATDLWFLGKGAAAPIAPE